MKITKKNFVCPASGNIANLQHCKSYSGGTGCKYFKKGECRYDRERK